MRTVLKTINQALHPIVSTFLVMIGSTLFSTTVMAKQLSADVAVSNSVGIATFLPGYQNTPLWTTSVSLSPSMVFPVDAGIKELVLSGDFSLDVWWLNSHQTSAYDAKHRIQVPDIYVALRVPQLVQWKDLGLSLSLGLPLAVPVSAPSVASNRLFGIGLEGGASLKKGVFSVSLAPRALAYVHRGVAKTIPCGAIVEQPDTLFPIINPLMPDSGMDQFALGGVSSEDLGEGECLIAGRQTLVSLRNTVGASATLSDHSISASISWYWNFLRPLEDSPELRGFYASGQNFTQAMLGRLTYRYKVPIEFPLAFTGGVITYQNVFDAKGGINLPFLDFATPASNQTQFFIDVSTEI